MAKPDKKALMKVYCCPPKYLLDQIFDPQTSFDVEKMVVDFSLSDKIAKMCIRLGIDYIACSPDIEKCRKFRKGLGFKDDFATGI